MNQTFQTSCFLSARHVILGTVHRPRLSGLSPDAFMIVWRSLLAEFQTVSVECQLSLLDVHVPSETVLCVLPVGPALFLQS